MKSLVVFYSKTGATRKVAKEIAEQLKCDSEEIFDTKNRDGVLGYMRAGRDGSMRRVTVLKPTKKDPAKYDCIIIGTPIWGWNVTPPARTYLRHNKGKLKKVAFFCTQGSSGAERAFSDMEKECGVKPLATFFLLNKDVLAGGFSKAVKDFVSAIKHEKKR